MSLRSPNPTRAPPPRRPINRRAALLAGAGAASLAGAAWPTFGRVAAQEATPAAATPAIRPTQLSILTSGRGPSPPVGDGARRADAGALR